MSGLALGLKVGQACFHFGKPGFCELSIPYFAEYLFHALARLLIYDSFAGNQVSIFRCIANHVTHVSDATAVHQVDG